MGRTGFSKIATRKMLETYFDRPITEASEELGVSTTIVKRLCRKFGIKRWPFRQINAINKSISMLQQVLPVMQTSQSTSCSFIEDRISYLLAKRETLIRNPNRSPRCLPSARQTPASPSSSLVAMADILAAASGRGGEGGGRGRMEAASGVVRDGHHEQNIKSDDAVHTPSPSVTLARGTAHSMFSGSAAGGCGKTVADSSVVRNGRHEHNGKSDGAAHTPAPNDPLARGTGHPMFSGSAGIMAATDSYTNPKARGRMIGDASSTGRGLPVRTSSVALFRGRDESAPVQESTISGSNRLCAFASFKKRGFRGGGEEHSFLRGFSNPRPSWARYAVAHSRKPLANGPTNKRPCLEPAAATDQTLVKKLSSLPGENITVVDNKNRGPTSSHFQGRTNSSTQARKRNDRINVSMFEDEEKQQQQTPLSTGTKGTVSPFTHQSNVLQTRPFFISSYTRNSGGGSGGGDSILAYGTSAIASVYPTFRERSSGEIRKQSGGSFTPQLDTNTLHKFDAPHRQSQGIRGSRGDEVVGFGGGGAVGTRGKNVYSVPCTASGQSGDDGDQDKANTSHVGGASLAESGRLRNERSLWATATASEYLLVEGGDSEIRPTSPVFRMWEHACSAEGAGRSWDSSCLASVGRASNHP